MYILFSNNICVVQEHLRNNILFVLSIIIIIIIDAFSVCYVLGTVLGSGVELQMKQTRFLFSCS